MFVLEERKAKLVAKYKFVSSVKVKSSRFVGSLREETEELRSVGKAREKQSKSVPEKRVLPYNLLTKQTP